MVMSTGAAQRGAHIHSASGFKYPGQRMAAMVLQKSGRFSSQEAGSSSVGQRPA